MKFIGFFNLKEDVTQTKLNEVLSRRAEYKFPEGMQLVAEYWTATRCPTVISVFEATDQTALMANNVAWLDAFEIERMIPVTDWQEGIKKLPKLLPRK